jgi:hypothetical protein
MSESINPHYDPSSSNGELYNTQIPELSENANIQEALRYFHYGTLTTPTSSSEILNESLAGHLKYIKSQVDVQASRGIGSVFQTSPPSLTENGYIWVDSDSVAPVFDTDSLSAVFSPIEPANNLNDGMLWVDSSASPLELYIYNGSAWEPVASAGTSYIPGGYSEFSLTGTGTDIVGYDPTTAAALGLNTTAFGYLVGATPTPFGVTLVSTGMDKVEVEFILGGTSGEEIAIYRVINGDPLTTTQIGKTFNNMPMKVVDTHGQPATTAITYGIMNLASTTVTVDGDYIIQAIAKEVA